MNIIIKDYLPTSDECEPDTMRPLVRAIDIEPLHYALVRTRLFSE